MNCLKCSCEDSKDNLIAVNPEQTHYICCDCYPTIQHVYECGKCQKEFIFDFSQKPLCPHCGSWNIGGLWVHEDKFIREAQVNYTNKILKSIDRNIEMLSKITVEMI
jgi:hypothetical protein